MKSFKEDAGAWKAGRALCEYIEGVDEDELSEDLKAARNIIMRNLYTEDQSIEQAMDLLNDCYNRIRHLENNEIASAIKKLHREIFI
jgi:hypothetical protein